MTRTGIDITKLHEAHAEFVWSTLYRLGIREADLPDLLQEVFLVAHRRADSFDGTSKATTWLYSICAKVASTHRRRAHVRREELYDPTTRVDRASEPRADDLVAEKRAKATLYEILDVLEPEKRAVFVMFELEERPCAEIAETFGIPLGTVHSRIHSARADFEKELSRLRLRERRQR